jgi:transcriptional regulator with GAF, ATPase, and Fis domain
MAEHPASEPAGGAGERMELAAAYGELQNLLLEGSDITAFLEQAVSLAAAVVPAAACSITIRRDHTVTTAASSHALAREVDEIQYGRGQGPCLQALHDGVRVLVPDLAADQRWPKYQPNALEHGVASSVSLPLTVEGDTLGALNLYGNTVDQFDTHALARAEAFAAQTITALRIVMHQTQQTTLEKQLREALASRALIDQAIGMIAGQQRVSATEAFGLLRDASQRRNIKLTEVAEELIQRLSGHPYEPPPPFTQR